MREIYQPCPCGSGIKTKFCCYEKRKSYNELSSIELLKRSSDFRIHEIWLNEDWQTTGLAHVLVIRQLFNLRYLASFYLVDVFCLGLKNTFSHISINAQDIQKLKNEIPQTLVEASYEDVRSITLGAIDYARQYDFEPISEVTSGWEKSKYMIESERTYENKFSFGKEGKPFYIRSANDDYLEIMRKLSPLINEGQATIQSLAETVDFDTDPESQDEYDDREDNDFEDDDLENQDNTEDTFEARCEYITEDLEEGYYEDALEGSEELIEDYPQEAMSYFYMGTTLAMMGDSEVGITYFNRAIELEPAGEFYHNLGRAYSAIGQITEAVASWEKTIELDGPEGELGKEAQKEINLLKNLDSATL
jgi:tetratricopeptide (TPR) repeat protein